MDALAAISIAIPTYGRDEILTDTIDHLVRQDCPATDILVLDQTVDHGAKAKAMLQRWSDGGEIRWFRLSEPSIPAAMNCALREAAHDIVLFLDDDIVPARGLVGAHAKAHAVAARLVAGRVLQPWDVDDGAASWEAKAFASTESREIGQFMGGNFSLDRHLALKEGGFDENFVRAAYNFEREFADRWRAAGRTIHFCPDALVRHLKAAKGGTRSFGEHMTTLSPAHSVGAYYYLLRSGGKGRLREALARLSNAVATRHHLHRPWWIPVTLVAELGGIAWALALYARGPRYATARQPVQAARGTLKETRG
jgi:glycosyltransferase involved in cell wall biosynthesis